MTVDALTFAVCSAFRLQMTPRIVRCSVPVKHCHKSCVFIKLSNKFEVNFWNITNNKHQSRGSRRNKIYHLGHLRDKNVERSLGWFFWDIWHWRWKQLLLVSEWKQLMISHVSQMFAILLTCSSPIKYITSFFEEGKNYLKQNSHKDMLMEHS